MRQGRGSGRDCQSCRQCRLPDRDRKPEQKRLDAIHGRHKSQQVNNQSLRIVYSGRFHMECGRICIMTISTLLRQLANPPEISESLPFFILFVEISHRNIDIYA